MGVHTFTADLKHSTLPAEVFEEYPPFKKCDCRVPSTAKSLVDDALWYPAIQMHCGACKKMQTFRASYRGTDHTRQERNRAIASAELSANISKGVARTGNAPPPTDINEHIRPYGFVITVDYLCCGCNDG